VHKLPSVDFLCGLPRHLMLNGRFTALGWICFDGIELMLIRTESERYLHQDMMRFIGAAAIVVAHFSEWVSWKGHRLPSFFVGGLGQMVDIFFVISGVVMFDLYHRRIAYLPFMRKRFARIAPLHYATLLAFAMKRPLAALLGVPYHDGTLVDPGCIIPNLTFTHAFALCRSLSFNTPSWSISAEFGAYALLPLALITARPSRGILIPLGLICVLTALSWRTELWFYWNYNMGVLRALPAFFFGCWLANHRDVLRRIPQPRMLFWAFLAVYPLLAYVYPSWTIFLCYVIAASAVAADDRPSDYLVHVAGLGRLSFSIYMLHLLIGSVLVDNLALKVLHLHDTTLLVFAVFTGFLLIPISMASLFWFEQPMRQLLLPGKQKLGANLPVTAP
jgi:peptidoglycan/LPS O-acetylase OafA/YrhL